MEQAGVDNLSFEVKLEKDKDDEFIQKSIIDCFKLIPLF